MFSSNQILEISGSLSNRNELEEVLEFALKYSGMNQGVSNLLYQITEDGKYCIGWRADYVPKGWLEYPFKFDINIVSQIIRQHLESFPVQKVLCGGSYEKGFIMKCIGEWMCSEKDGIKNPFYGIIYFKPYTCFYSK